MQILSPGFDFSHVASSLSLAPANYKPVPVVQNSTNGRNAEVQHGSDGLPSILHVPERNGNQFKSNRNASGNAVGSSGCAIIDAYTPKGSLHVEFPSYNKSRSNMMRYREQVGVNTGSWFVLENWMVGSLFECAAGSKASELDVLHGYGSSSVGIQSAKALLEKHWDTFITEHDFHLMKSAGINTIRLPIGYWTAGAAWTNGSAYNAYGDVYENTWKYVRRAIAWADKYDIGVLVDLHGAYGSQNGQAHSGVSGGHVGFYTQANEKRTRDLLLWITEHVAGITNVVGIELLNEPRNNNALWPWYSKTMDAMRKVSPYAKNLPLYFHDAFSPREGSRFVNTRTDFVVQDTHSYFVFTNQDRGTSANAHTSNIQGPLLNAMTNTAKTARGNLIVGEWSCALNPNSLSHSKHPQETNAKFCQAQTDTYRKATAGAHFWSWTMENCKANAGWCFKAALPGYMDDAYNAWGFNNRVSNDTIAHVSSSISSTKLPHSYATTKTEVAAQTARTAQSHTASSHASPSSATHSHQRRMASAQGGPSASHMVHRRAVSDKHAGNLGYADGFLTAQLFADQLTLSRVGFVEQYLTDTVDYYTKAKVLRSHTKSAYKKEFGKGLKKLEKDIVKQVKARA